jgi:hypothetical protein
MRQSLPENALNPWWTASLTNWLPCLRLESDESSWFALAILLDFPLFLACVCVLLTNTLCNRGRILINIHS